MSRSTKPVFLPTLTHFSEVISQRKNNRQLLLSACFQSSAARPFEAGFAAVSGNFKSLRILPFFALFIAPLANAGNYYVATNGNDSNPGTLSSPWRTISKAANTLVAGDTVSIRAGTYQEQVRPKNSGNASGFITYTAYPGETVTIDGSRGLNLKWSGIFDITNRRYLQVSDLHFANSPGFGIFMTDSNDLRILGNYTYRTSNSGIYMSDSNALTIDGNEIDTASNGGDENNGIQESLSIMDSRNITVSNNSVHNGGMEGIDAKGSSNVKIFGNNVHDMARVGIYVDSYSDAPLNIEIYNNKIDAAQTTDRRNSRPGIMLGAEEGNAVDSVKIYDNIIYNSTGSGIQLSNYSQAGAPAPRFSNISIYNNTVYNDNTGN
jgi:parallel beta-helix repeat protein